MHSKKSPSTSAGITARLLGAALSASIALLLTTPRADAELLIGLTTENSLISFDSATPGTVNTIGPVTGLLAGDMLIGIDRRPQALNNMSSLPGPNNGLLYALGVNTTTGTGRIYTLNETTGLATPGFSLTADPADTMAPTPFTTISGTSFGIDFNPMVDRLRVTSNTGENLRINVDTGRVQLDVPLFYQAGDVNAGDVPMDLAVAYSNNFGNAASTVLRGVDVGQGPDALVMHVNPNAGSLMTQATLPFNGDEATAYDISGLSGTPYFAIGDVSTFAPSSSLYAGGPGGIALVGSIGGTAALVGLAAPVGAPISPVIPEPGTALVGLALCAFIGANRARRRG